MRYTIKLTVHSAYMDFQYKGRCHNSLTLDLAADTDARNHIVETLKLLEQIQPVEIGYETFRSSQYLFTGEISWWNMACNAVTGTVSAAIDNDKVYDVNVDVCFDIYGRLVERDDSNENSIWFSLNYQISRVSNDFFEQMQELEEDIQLRKD